MSRNATFVFFYGYGLFLHGFLKDYATHNSIIVDLRSALLCMNVCHVVVRFIKVLLHWILENIHRSSQADKTTNELDSK